MTRGGRTPHTADMTGEGASGGSGIDARKRAAWISFAASTAFFAIKFAGYLLTGSTAVLSDALESIVNVIAAAFVLGTVAFATRPADSNHPYGHGKAEFLSSAFEGGLIAFAAILIVYQAVEALWVGISLRDLDSGIGLMVLAAIGNAALGVHLRRVGRATRSPALEADGAHVLTDVWTTVGVIAGLGLVRLTGIATIDPLVAIGVGLHLGFVGARLVRDAVGALLDESDPRLLERLGAAIASTRMPGVIAVHRLRAIRSGGAVHVDAHVVVPCFWQVSVAHEVARRFEEEIVGAIPDEGDIAFHVDPCRRVYCPICPVEPCPVRQHPFVARPTPTLDDLTGDPPAEE